ncbi:unnamed protein product [Protopolystoma xenopodis]|uniref:Uncharacterized protein n=1 Tax=Protopolystoma xenopodis TaxID=117903 RepID=A0A448WJ82_9PLAT|nr:unnamed protein product [Protopolystoma xenopodis]
MTRLVVSRASMTWIVSTLSSCALLLPSLLHPGWLQRIDTPETRKLAVCPANRRLLVAGFSSKIAKTLVTSERVRDISFGLGTPIGTNEFKESQALLSTTHSIGPFTRCQLACDSVSASRHVMPANNQPTWSHSNHPVPQNMQNTWQQEDLTTGEVDSDEQGRVVCLTALVGFGRRPALGNALAWSAAFTLLLALCLLVVAACLAVTSIAKREVCERSIFSITGVLQCIAGEFENYKIIVLVLDCFYFWR